MVHGNDSRMILPPSLSVRTLIVAAFVLVCCSQAYGDDVTWTGNANNDWGNGSNWNGGSVPTNEDFALISSGTVDITSSSDADVLGFRQSGGTINISGGTVEAGQVGQTSDFDGSVTQSGGFTSINKVRIGAGANSNGSFTVTGGQFNIARAIGNISLNLGGLSSGSGSLTIAGGSFAARETVRLGGNASNGTGTFAVMGSQPSSIVIGGNGVDGLWSQAARSSLVVRFDNGGVTPIFINDDDGNGAAAFFENGAILDVDRLDANSDLGGTWTVLEVENGDVFDFGLEFAPGVDTSVWSFEVDNSGTNGKLIVTAVGEPAQQVGFDLMVGTIEQQKMRFGMDYERLWSWSGSLDNGERDEVAKWSAIDTRIDYIRVAMNSKYELEEGNLNLSAYTSKIIPMMQDMKDANPDIKFFASPRPLNEAYSSGRWTSPEGVTSNVTWQPYPIWVTGASTPVSGDYDFNDIKCGEYIERYLLLMKSYGFDISFLDLSNEWQSNVGGGRMTQSDARDVVQYLKDSDILAFAGVDMPLFVGPSAWEYSQGASWIANLSTQARRDAIDIASCHNTNRDSGSGTAQGFADAVHARLGDETEVWNTEVHGWKSTGGGNETTTFSFYLEKIRAGFSGLNSWLAIGKKNQGHAYILNETDSNSPIRGIPTRNVKYFIFKKLSETSNYGHALDIVEEPSQLSHTAALIRGNLMTVWVINQGSTDVPLTVSPLGRTISESKVKRTRWTDPSDVEGFVTHETVGSNDSFFSSIPGESVCCFEILLDPEDEENGFQLIQAEDDDGGNVAINLASGDDGGTQSLSFITGSNWARYDNVSLTENSDMRFRVARPSGRDDGWVEVYLGSPGESTASILAGKPAGKVAVPETGDWLDYETIEASLENLEGDYDVVLDFAEVGSTNGTPLFNLNWLSAVGPVTALPGDFNDDGNVDLADLDQYNGNMNEPATGALAALDLNGDGIVGADDLQIHYGTLIETSNGGVGTFAGDLNLDGTVDVLNDAFVLLGNLGGAASSWASGDMNADGLVDVLSDAFQLIGNLGESNVGSQ